MSRDAPKVRLFPFASDSGARNMAADEVMLDCAAAGAAALRFYGWDEATVSLGYFQPESVRQSIPTLAGLPFVRRPSGGATLVHQFELTYALALPAGRAWHAPGRSWVCRMHSVIAAALATLGVTVRTCACGEERKLGEVLCFLHQSAGDLILAGHKVVGSAQRRQRGALLQHGAILLARSPFAPSLPGIAELDGVELAVAAVTAAAQEAFTEESGWLLAKDDWTASQRARIESLAREKYATDGWNRKR